MNQLSDVSILFIGDPHIKADNIPESELLIKEILRHISEVKPDICILGGDIQHYHEKLYTVALNKAHEMVKRISDLVPVYILVGNHDMINNQQFLTDNHWMNSMKYWGERVKVVDKPFYLNYKGYSFVMCPYVYPGRFEEALNTIKDQFNWLRSDCIFSHQEFKGCKMGAITSIEGDNWDEDNPMVVCGHIHSNQKPQKNIYYPGSSMQQAFGESDKCIIANLVFKDGEMNITELELNLPRKKIINLDISKIDDFKMKEGSDKIRLTITGDYDEFKSFKKTEKFKKLNEKGVKVVFRHKKIKKDKQEEKELKDINDFDNILSNLVGNSKNINLIRAYELIVNNKKIGKEDILFL
jgi:DNA repair exonuclease SbcCD nuclease subunit